MIQTASLAEGFQRAEDFTKSEAYWHLLRGALNTSRFVCNHVPKSNFMGSI